MMSLFHSTTSSKMMAGKWKIISVIANGINDLSLKRADYSAIIKERGFDASDSQPERKNQ